MTSSFPFRGCNTGVVGAGNQGKKHEKGQQSHTHAFSQQKEHQRTKGNQFCLFKGKQHAVRVRQATSS